MNAPAGFTANPQLSASAPPTITWPNGGNILASAYGTQFVVETSNNLVIWTDVPVGELVTNTDGTPAGSSWVAYACPLLDRFPDANEHLRTGDRFLGICNSRKKR